MEVQQQARGETCSEASGPTERSAPLRVGLAGCALDTGNLGVSALALATLSGLRRSGAPLDVVLFDRGPGVRRRQIEGREILQVPGFLSRRFYSPANLQQAHLAAVLGMRRIHPMLRRLDSLDALLDVSGGDSFADLYGARRFQGQTLLKRTALRIGVPLVLLPQTYGPFREPAHRAIARDIVARADQAWARDLRGLQALQELLGERFDAKRHRAGVDVAFGLVPREPADAAVADELQRFAAGGDLLLGLNVSGLLYPLDGVDCRRRFGFRSAYREIVGQLLRALLAQTGARVALISHVVPENYAEGGDLEACQALRSELRAPQRERVQVVPALRDPCETKWLIGRCDWFSGARMHACIGALSQGIPTVGLAYSDKALGVVESAGAGDWVVDPRTLGGEAVVRRVISTLDQRDAMRATLGDALKRVRARLDEQFAEMLAALTRART